MQNLIKKLAVVAAVFIAIHLVLLTTDNLHIYPTLRHTIFKGRLGPAIDEFSNFPFRSVAAQPSEPRWTDSPDKNKKQPSPAHMKVLSELGTVALFVAKGNTILLEQYFDGYSDSSRSNSFSMAKSFVSMAIGKALSEGAIKSLDDPIVRYIPWYGQPGDAHIVTIRHLLTMSSGIAFDEHYLNPFAFPAKANYGYDLKSLVVNYRPADTPGKVFDYQSGNTQLLAFVVEAATGVSISEYFSKKIWQPLGAQHAAYWSLDSEDGMEKGFCCFNSNARDFALLGRLFLDSGKVDGQQILPANFVAESITKAKLLEADGTTCMRYGYQWWLWNYKGVDVFYARGIKGQYIICVPSLDMVIVRLGHKRKKPIGYEPPPEFITLLDVAFEQADRIN
jgi:CubicO group peptidase (beta-lactamase class C family)